MLSKDDIEEYLKKKVNWKDRILKISIIDNSQISDL